MTKTASSTNLSRLALAAVAAVALAGPIGAAHADKVGVAAAVNPDAFSSLSGSPQTELNIGKSIFFNERINTTGKGLVQVLLVDGSTFTVGPGSDLVIDKFVYDPNKKSGQIVASFTKGAMRFVGGKISKNEGGVTVNTPSGALAIRGGMVQGSVTGNKAIFSFLFGETMTLTGKNGQEYTVFQPGNTIDTTGGVANIRPTTAGDIALIMAALTPGGNGGVTPGPTPTPGETGVKAATLGNVASEVINEATATQIQDQIQKQIDAIQNPPPPGTPVEPPPTTITTGDTPPPPPPPVQTAVFGYAGGVFSQSGGGEDNNDPPVGTLANLSPGEVGALFDGNTNAFQGAGATLYVNNGKDSAGGVKLTFLPVAGLPVGSGTIPPELQGASLFSGLAGVGFPNSIKVFNDTTGNPPQLTTEAVLNAGSLAFLIGLNGAGSALCQNCDFLTWGAWGAALNFQNNSGDPRNVVAAGWWVAGNVPTVGELPLQGTATYSGTALGNVTVSQRGVWQQPYTAKGDLSMGWDFAYRKGLLAITNFDKNGPRGPVNVFGIMKTPGTLATTDFNKFSGQLGGFLGPAPGKFLPSVITGSAVGSFAANGPDKSAGVIGNWNVGNSSYKAAGIFAGARNGSINLPPNFALSSHAD